MNKWKDQGDRGNSKGLLPQYKAFIDIIFECTK